MLPDGTTSSSMDEEMGDHDLYRQAFELIDDMLFLTVGLEVVTFNQVAEDVLKDSASSLIGSEFTQLAINGHREKLADTLQDVLDGRVDPCYEIVQLELADVGPYQAELLARKVDHPEGPGLFITVRGLTSSEEIERRMASESRMALLSQVAAGIAHEVNTPLASMNLLAENVARKTDDDVVKQKMEVLTNLVQQVSTSVNGLINFTQMSREMSTIIEIEELLEDLIEEYAQHDEEVVRAVKVEMDIEDEGLKFRGNSVEMKRGLRNLINNAIEASEPGSVVILRVNKLDDRIKLTVIDQGNGMSPADLKQAMQLFYTTKKSSGGTGLGLPLTDSIVSEHGGDMMLESEEGVGTRVFVRLPLVNGS